MILAIFASSCETYDDYDTDRPVVIGFTLSNSNVKIPNGGTRDKSVDVFISEAASVDRTFTVSVIADQTELAAENYSFDATLLIPANERFAQFVLTGIDMSLTTDKLPLTLQVNPKDGILSGGKITYLIFK